jgi:hypothetical protein
MFHVMVPMMFAAPASGLLGPLGIGWVVPDTLGDDSASNAARTMASARSSGLFARSIMVSVNDIGGFRNWRIVLVRAWRHAHARR